MKKLLILGGASVHCKMVEAARDMGVYTVVVDYLVDSPAKKIADKAYLIDVNDIEGLVKLCADESINAVITSHLDPCQRPYQVLCERLNVPCLGTREQVYCFTDKHEFKRICKASNVDTIQEYTTNDVENNDAEYPVFVKPVDSRGSRGQTVCYSADAVKKAVAFAKSESSNGDILIEKYMAGYPEVQITYFVINGEPYLIRTVDSYKGDEDDGLDKVVKCAVSPSIHTEEYLHSAHKNVVKMIKKAGIVNGPVFMQGFYDEGKFRFFDPGLRFPGVDYERIYKKVFGIDLLKEIINFAFTGCLHIKNLPDNSVYLNGKSAAVLFPTISSGIIADIKGTEKLLADEAVVSILERHTVGDNIQWTYDVNQRLSEIDVVCDNINALKVKIKDILDSIDVYDKDGNSMIYSKFDADEIKEMCYEL